MVGQCVHWSLHLYFSACHTIRILIGGMSSRGFGCDPCSPVSDLYWACVTSKGTWKVSAEAPSFSSSAWCLCRVLSFLTVWLRGGKESTSRWEMFPGLWGDFGEGGELCMPAVKKGTVDFTEPHLVTGSGSGSQAYCSRSQGTTETGQTSYPAVCCLDGVADYGGNTLFLKCCL